MKLSEVTNVFPDYRVYEPSNELPDGRQAIGVEIEVERSRPTVLGTVAYSKYWDLKEDESLRVYGVEIVHKAPMFGVDLLKSLEDLEDCIKKEENGDILLTARGSVHVHIDVRDWDVDVLLRFIALFLMYEPLLFKVYGDGRQDNNFCIPWGDTEFSTSFGSVISKKSSLRNLLTKCIKYMSLNLSCSTTYGSIEVRVKSSALGNELREWINILLSMTAFVKQNSFDIRDLPKMSSIQGFGGLTKSIFGKYSDVFTERNDFLHLIYKGVRSLQDSIYLEKNTALQANINNLLPQVKPFFSSNRLKQPEADTVTIPKKKELVDFEVFYTNN